MPSAARFVIGPDGKASALTMESLDANGLGAFKRSGDWLKFAGALGRPVALSAWSLVLLSGLHLPRKLLGAGDLGGGQDPARQSPG